jgi:hypothetical protein
MWECIMIWLQCGLLVHVYVAMEFILLTFSHDLKCSTMTVRSVAGHWPGFCAVFSGSSCA